MLPSHYRVYDHSERQPHQGITVIPRDPDPWDAYTEQDEIFVHHWKKLVGRFPEYTFYICDDEDRLLVGGTAAPLYFDEPLDMLPDGGWRWVVETAINNTTTPNVVSALGINVVPSHRGQGLSRLALEYMRARAADREFTNLIAPVRPSHKHLFPLIPMQDYIHWRRADGLLFDAWMRAHERLGAAVIRVANSSMVVRGTVQQWEQWTNFQFPGSGQHIVAGALNPIAIDLEANTGTYIEPNVWMVHPLT